MSQWELHKNTLRQHFLTEDMTLEGVRKIMREKYDFGASKTQYERQFKKWGFRKNLKTPDWKFVCHWIEQRKRADKSSDVYIDGVLTPELKIRKEISRRYFPTAQELYGHASSPKMSGRIYICTPPPSNTNLNIWLLDNLPWLQFQATIESRVNPHPDLGAVAMSIFSSSNGSTVPSRAKDIPLPDSTFTTVKLVTSAMSSWVVASKSQSRTVRCFHNHLRAIIPEKTDCKSTDDKELRKLIKLDGDVQFFSLAVYLVSNNMLDIKNASMVIDAFQGERNRRLLRSLLSIRSRTIEAFAEKLFLAATKSRNLDVMQECLNVGVDPDSHFQGRTALQYAATCGDMNMAKTLVRAGADVNAPFQLFRPVGYVLLDGSNDFNFHIRRTALQAAAENGNFGFVQYLLGAGADVNAPPAAWEGKTALQAASRNGSTKLLQLLIAAGANVNASAGKYLGFTALQGAVKNGDVELVQYLLTAGADINASGSDLKGKTALQEAAGAGDVELARILLEAGAEINASPDTRSIGRTALQAAVENGNIEMVQHLLAAGADINAPALGNEQYTAVQLAAQRGNIDLLQILLAVGADINAPAAKSNGYTALQAAVAGKNVHIAQFLVAAGADVNAPASENGGGTALEVAVRTVNIELVQFLLSKGANPNISASFGGYTALQRAASQDDMNLLEILLAAGADVNAAPAAEFGRTALQVAADSGNLIMIKALLAAGADVNAPAAAHGRTALQFAANAADLDMVRALLAVGADVNAAPAAAFGRTALQGAAKNCNMDVIKVLLEAGADVNAKAANIAGRTPLQAAAEKGNIGLVQFLLAAGADVNASPAQVGGVTSLQAASIQGYVGLAKVLLEAGADVNGSATVGQGRTALEGAAEYGRIDMVQLLLNAGAELHGSGETQYRNAVNLASENGHNAIRRLLESKYESDMSLAKYQSDITNVYCQW